MENASKALLMAAGVLIGILILSLAVYLFATFGATSAEVHRQNDANRINEFNTQFTSYEGKQDITIYDVITVANLATENNINYELKEIQFSSDGVATNYYIQVFFRNRAIERGFETSTPVNYNDLLLQEIDKTSGKLTNFKCKTYVSSITQRVYRIDFSEK